MSGIWLVGCGNMGGAMLRRWIDSGMAAQDITVVDPRGAIAPAGVEVRASAEGLPAPDIVVLAVKPQNLDEVAPPLIAALDNAPIILVSILAGVDEAALGARFPGAAIIRAMPNLPVAIGQGVVALHGDKTDAAARAAVEHLMTPLGLVEWIAGEALFDAVTALSGCGPGFVFRFIDALTEGGVALGLPADQAARLAKATVAGTGAMGVMADESAATLADRVASPGGSTRKGLDVLDHDDALKRLLAETLRASARRNAELAAAAR